MGWIMLIEFKDDGVLEDCLRVRWHPTLIQVLNWIVENFRDVTITEGWREGGPKDVHCTDPLRAFDMRSWVFPEPEFVETKINRAWIYDKKRPLMQVANLHDSGQGIHLHIQIHPNTVKAVY